MKCNFLVLALKHFLYSLIFQGMKTLKTGRNFSSLKNRKIHPKKIFCTLGNGSPKNASSTFSKESFSYILENANPENVLCISENGIFLYFRKWKP